MRATLSRVAIATAVAGLVAAPLGSAAYGAEKQKHAWAKRVSRVVSSSKFLPGDVPNHEMEQKLHVGPFTRSSGLEFVEQEAYTQADTTAGNGTHRGTLAFLDRAGDKVFGTYEGTHRLVTKGGGAWELPFEGKYQFTGGTGKFQNIKGTGAYRGKITPEGEADEGEGEHWFEPGPVAGADATSGAQPGASPK
jgi:hypothetical protein